jgi:hypothetical protein
VAGVVAASSPASIRLHGSIVLAGPENSEDKVVLVDRDGHRTFRASNVGRERSYAFEELAPGEYVLEASAWGHRADRRTIVLRPEEPDHREDFTLETVWVLHVRLVTADGEPLAESLPRGRRGLIWITVFATTERPGDTLAKGFTMERQEESIGTLHPENTFDGLGGGRCLDITSDPPIFVSAAMREQILAMQRVDTRVPEIKLVVDPERIAGSLASLTLDIVDAETDAPARDAAVQLKTNQMSISKRHPDERGHVTFTGWMPGLYELQIDMPDRAFTTIPVDLAPGQTTDLGTVRLEKGVEIRGRCIDEHGAEVKDFVPSLQRFDDDPRALRGPVTIHESNRDVERGGFVFRGLAAGRYVIAPDPPNFLGDNKPRNKRSFVPVLVDTRNGPVEDVVLVVRSSAPLVLRPTSEVLAGVRYEVWTRDGALVRSGEFRGNVPERMEIAPGEYRLRLSRKDALIREIPIVLGADLRAIDVDP